MRKYIFKSLSKLTISLLCTFLIVILIQVTISPEELSIKSKLKNPYLISCSSEQLVDVEFNNDNDLYYDIENFPVFDKLIERDLYYASGFILFLSILILFFFVLHSKKK